MRDERSGIYGAFAARVPVGKTLACVAAVVLVFPCLVITKWAVGPVGWLEKGVYAKASLGAMTGGFRKPSSVQTRTYLVAVEEANSTRMYTNESLSAGRRGRWIWVRLAPSQMREMLGRSVYGGKLATRTAALWLGWPVLLILSMIVGQQIDMARLRRARHSGVWIRGNREVDASEWNSRAGAAR
jgi:hypothetical protein